MHRLAVFCSWPAVPAQLATHALNQLLSKFVRGQHEHDRGHPERMQRFRGPFAAPRRDVSDSWLCIEFVLCKEALVHSKGKVHGHAQHMQLHANGLGLMICRTNVCNISRG